jgi:tetratricopeptide (TPR) repeat protein
VTGIGAAAIITPWTWGYWPYYNPYCTGPVTIYDTTVDYSQPIILAGSNGDASPGEESVDADKPAAPDSAAGLLDAARDAFTQGDYTKALAQCDKAIAKQSGNTVLHEFRALALFALQRYKEAAAPLYAALSVGPGWDWTTLSGMYPSVDVYTEQLRSLEQYVKSHPKEPEAKFLLAYHYMTCGHVEAATAQLKDVVQLAPKDRLSAQLLAAMTAAATADDDDAKKPADDGAKKPEDAASTPSKPVEAAALVGQWKAEQPDGAAITLRLTKEGKYTWTVAQKGKPREFNGDYTVADNLLILKQNAKPVMVGEVTLKGNAQFNFKMPGDNPADSGLTFAK